MHHTGQLNPHTVQILLRAAGYYGGEIDGIVGPATLAAANRILQNHTGKFAETHEAKRRIIIAVQLVLDAAGYEPGPIDGYAGHNTLEAMNAWLDAQGEKSAPTPDRDKDPKKAPTARNPKQTRWPRQKDVLKFYGPVGKNQTRIELPYPMVVAWNTSQQVKTMMCHKKVADAMTWIFDETLNTYGYAEISRLGLNMYGGCLNVRKMRGGSRYSMHSWGIAVDIDPAHNRLKWNKSKARMAQPEYERFWEIVEAAGAISLGRERDFDWMHFQFARL